MSSGNNIFLHDCKTCKNYTIDDCPFPECAQCIVEGISRHNCIEVEVCRKETQEDSVCMKYIKKQEDWDE